MTKNLSDGRINLIPASPEMIKSELASNGQIHSLLRVTEPAYWPPELNDSDSFRFALGLHENGDAAAGWGFYYVVDISKPPIRQLVGLGGFKGAPDPEGQVEIGYSILTPHRRRGFAIAMCDLLIEKAFSDERVQKVAATTLSDLIPSIGVLEKLGFSFAGEEEGVVTYLLFKQ